MRYYLAKKTRVRAESTKTVGISRVVVSKMVKIYKREVLEEVGVDISPYIIELVDNADTGTAEKIIPETGEKVMCEMHFNVYKIVLNDKKSDDIAVMLNDDLAEHQWVTLLNLKNYQLTPPSIKLFIKLGYL